MRRSVAAALAAAATVGRTSSPPQAVTTTTTATLHRQSRHLLVFASSFRAAGVVGTRGSALPAAAESDGGGDKRSVHLRLRRHRHHRHDQQPSLSHGFSSSSGVSGGGVAGTTPAIDAQDGDGGDAMTTTTTTKMRFATGLSKHEDLAQAVVEAVAEVKSGLGGLGHDRVPTWIQLMVSGDYLNPSMAPAFTLECFTPAHQVVSTAAAKRGSTPAAAAATAAGVAAAAADETAAASSSSSSSSYPVLFGGVVTGCIGGRGQTMDGPSVSVTAAYMPGVEAIGFHTEVGSVAVSKLNSFDP